MNALAIFFSKKGLKSSRRLFTNYKVALDKEFRRAVQLTVLLLLVEMEMEMEVDDGAGVAMPVLIDSFCSRRPRVGSNILELPTSKIDRLNSPLLGNGFAMEKIWGLLTSK